MQRCRFCGQLNDDITDQCIYCGEDLYIEVDHSDDLSERELNRQYAAKIAEQLLEDERRKQQQKQPNLFDDLDDFAKELLSMEDGVSFEDDGGVLDDEYPTDDDVGYVDEKASAPKHGRRVEGGRNPKKMARDVYHDDEFDDIYEEDRIKKPMAKHNITSQRKTSQNSRSSNNYYERDVENTRGSAQRRSSNDIYPDHNDDIYPDHNDEFSDEPDMLYAEYKEAKRRQKLRNKAETNDIYSESTPQQDVDDALFEEENEIYIEGSEEDISVDHSSDDDYIYQRDSDEYITDNEFIEDEEFITDDQTSDITIDDNSNIMSDEQIMHRQDVDEAEANLKCKIKRNKHLEDSLGIDISNVELILKDTTGPFNIFGNVTLKRSAKPKNAVKITIKCFNRNKNVLCEDSSILPVDHLREFNEFDITFSDVKICDIYIMIIVPELISITPGDVRGHLKANKLKSQSKDDVIKDNIKSQQDNGSVKSKDDRLKASSPVESKTRNGGRQSKSKRSIKDRLFNNGSGATKSSGGASGIYLEQMKDIERKIGMSIDNTSVLIKSSDRLEVVGEIHIENPEKCRDIKIATTCYDEDNHIIDTRSSVINTKLFLGFDTLHVVVSDVVVDDIKRIRLYPTFFDG